MPPGWTPLSYTAMRQELGGGLRDTRCHIGHQYYKDDQGDYQDANYQLVDRGAYWELIQASYRARINKDFGAPLLIQFTNRYEGANHSIFYEPHSIWWVNADQKSQRQQFRAAQSVQGVYDPAENKITWINAFGAWIDFEVEIGRSGIKKWIVANAPPPPGPYANSWLVPVFKWTATGLMLKRLEDNADWDNSSYFEGERFTVEQIGNRDLKSFIRRSNIVDAIGQGRKLRVMFERRQGTLWQGKIIPQALLTDPRVVYPVRADTVTDFYSGADDCYIEAGNANWATCQGAAAGDEIQDTLSFLNLISTEWPGTAAYGIRRVFLPIDTSAIPDGDVISAATMYLYVESKNSTDNDGDDWFNIVEASPADPTAIVVADYDTCGDAVDNPTEGSTRQDVTTLATGAYTTFALNAAGLTWINKTGWTVLGVREGHDCIDSAPGNDLEVRVRMSSSEYAGVAQDPYLSVTHAGGATVLVVQDATHAQSTDSIALTQKQLLAVASADHAQTAEAPALTQKQLLAVDGALHAQTVDNVTLSTSIVLVVQDATHAQTAEAPALIQAFILIVADALHSQTAEAPALLQAFVLAVADATHAQTADNITLSISILLVVQDATHGQTADNVDLVQGFVLAVAGATHAQTSESPELLQAFLLAVEDALHAQSAEAVVLVMAVAGLYALHLPAREFGLHLDDRDGLGTPIDIPPRGVGLHLDERDGVGIPIDIPARDVGLHIDDRP